MYSSQMGLNGNESRAHVVFHPSVPNASRGIITILIAARSRLCGNNGLIGWSEVQNSMQDCKLASRNSSRKGLLLWSLLHIATESWWRTSGTRLSIAGFAPIATDP
jgi:hypothetical protein